MKRITVLLLALVMMACILPSCASAEESAPETTVDPAVVNLMDMYSVTDPEGVDYDQRIAMYMPIIESDEHYADGCRHMFVVIYGNEGKGVYMYSVEIYETEEQATEYMVAAESGEVDGVVYIVSSDAAFFAMMESFIPDLDTWLTNLMLSGMMEIE